jgi:prepilin-type N-terminal cleavage/methylation domain-containing protein
MKKSAFTLIELIVVISIMVIIASSSIFYFMHFIDSQKVNQKISIIDEQFKDLDKRVNKYTIFDYKLFLSTSDT